MPHIQSDEGLELQAPAMNLQAEAARNSDGRVAENEDQDDDLPPVDGGFAAWRMIVSAFIFESLLWGFPLSFGVFQNYYSHLPEFANQPYVTVIGTVTTGICYMGAPIIIPLLRPARKYRAQMLWTGWILCIIGILASSFARTLSGIIFTQGVMYGTGFVIFYYPVIAMVNEYWVARRGLAYGILCSSSGFAGIVMPFALEALLENFGLHTTLRAVSIGLAVTTGPLIPFLRGRLPPSEQTAPAPTNWSFLRVPLFWIYAASNLIQGLGYFFPSLYLPSYASSIGKSSRAGALLLAVMSVSQVFGQVTFGYMSDRRATLNNLILLSTTLSAIAILAMWGLAHDFALLCIFAVIYGFFAAGYTAMWGRMGTAVTSESSSAFTAFGLFNFGKGFGNIFAGPISASLLFDSVHINAYAAKRYEGIVLFSGSCMLASGIIAAGAYIKPWKAATT